MFIQISFLFHYVVTIWAHRDRKNVTLEKVTHNQVTVHQVVWEAVLQAPKVLICRKSEQNRGKFGQIWCPMLFDFKILHPTFPEKHMKTFLDVIPQKDLHDLWSLWRNFVGKVPENFSGKFGKIRAKILRTPKNLPAPKPMYIYRFLNQNVMVFRHK